MNWSLSELHPVTPPSELFPLIEKSSTADSLRLCSLMLKMYTLFSFIFLSNMHQTTKNQSYIWGINIPIFFFTIYFLFIFFIFKWLHTEWQKEALSVYCVLLTSELAVCTWLFLWWTWREDEYGNKKQSCSIKMFKRLKHY